MKTWTYETLKAAGLIIFECIAGSRAYGTAIETSDTDIRYVYVLPLEDLLGLHQQEQANNPSNDITGYELGRFLFLLAKGNPTVLELLAMPADSVVYQHRVYEQLLEVRERFLTKVLRNSLAGFVNEQISKAKGLDKKMNWDAQQMKRKTPLDFCWVAQPDGSGSESLAHFIEGLNGRTQRNFGAVPVPNMPGTYHLYFNSNPTVSWVPGLLNEAEDSNSLRLASVPKGILPVRVMSYNQDGYSQHCKKYREYEEWLEKRNTARYVDTQTHGQQIDGKNMMHCRRLLDTAREIATGQGLQVRRPNREALLAIRRGEVNLEELLATAKEEVAALKELFLASDLPDNVDHEFVNALLIRMRLFFYVSQSVTLIDLAHAQL